MRSANRFSMLTLGLALVLGLSSAAVSMADEVAPVAPAANTGTISGKVLDATGNAAKGVKVSAFAAPVKGAKHVKGQRPEAVSTVDTADDGTFKLLNVPAGEVMVVAKADKEEGHVKGKTTVTAGQDTKVDDITLAPAKERKARKAKQ